MTLMTKPKYFKKAKTLMDEYAIFALALVFPSLLLFVKLFICIFKKRMFFQYFNFSKIFQRISIS